MSMTDLLTLFGTAWTNMIWKPLTRSTSPGKHYRTKKNTCRRPAGSKLMKRFNRLEWENWCKTL